MKAKIKNKTKSQKNRQKKLYIKIASVVTILFILLLVFFIKRSYENNKNDMLLAEKIGIQLYQIGQATQRYIDIRHDLLAELASPSNNGNDPGPRECDQYTNICTITYKTLINEGLLDPNFKTDYFNYNISIRKEGNKHSYHIHGLIMSDKPWIINNKIKEDLLDIAMSKAGGDSGKTINDSEIWGYKGDWFLNSYTFPDIKKKGMLGYRVGY